MSEVGLVPFARVALEVAREVLPSYSHRFSPQRFTQPQLLAIDTSRRLSLAQKAHQGPVNDCATLRPLLDEVVTTLPITTVLADAEFDSERNHRHIREQCRAKSIIPAKRTRPEWKLHGVRAQMRAAFPAKAYRQRVHAETVFSAIKRKLSARAPGRSLITQRKQALLLGLAYNLYRLWRRAILQLPVANA